jgi:hydrogenase nickel incorporation protein HypA/HybF
MHELSIALSIVDGVLEEAKRHASARVETVYVRVGQLSGVDKDALLFSYRVASENTPLRDSRLVIEDVVVVIHCPKCNADRPAHSFPALFCATCGTVADRVVDGEQLEINRLELAA